MVFHVQTEDSGQANPHLFTHLFHEGVIVSTRKYVYDASSNEDSIKGLMQAQHKAVMKDLRKGTFDDKIDQYLGHVPGLEPRASAGARPRTERAETEQSEPPVEAAQSLSSGAPAAIEIVNEDLSSPIELPVKPRTKTAERTSKASGRGYPSAPPPPPLPEDDPPTELTRAPIVRFQTPPPTLGANLRESSPILELTIEDEEPGRAPRDTAVEALIDPNKTIPVQQQRPASHGAAALPPMKAPSRPSISPPVVTSRPAPAEMRDDELSQPVEIYAPAPPSADPPPGERSERASQYSISRASGAPPIREKTGRIAAVNPNPNAIPAGLNRPRPGTASPPVRDGDRDTGGQRASPPVRDRDRDRDTGGQRAVPPAIPREPTPGNRPGGPPAPPRSPTPGSQQPGGRVHVTSPITNRPGTPASPQANSGVVMTRPAVIVGAPPKPPTTQPLGSRVRKAREEEGRGFGQGLISEKSLDEVILAYLSEDAEEK